MNGGATHTHQRAAGARVREASTGTQQRQLAAAEAGDEDLDQPAAGPASAGQLLIEGCEASGQDFELGGAAATPDSRMLE